MAKQFKAHFNKNTLTMEDAQAYINFLEMAVAYIVEHKNMDMKIEALDVEALAQNLEILKRHHKTIQSSIEEE